MYLRLNVKVKSLSGKTSDLIDRSIPVHKSFRQGAIASSPLFNNSVIDAQKKVEMSFIFRGLDLSLLNYADDILNLSRILALTDKNFASLSEEHNDIGLKFNPSKSECIKFNSKRPGPDSTTGTFSDSDIELSSSLTDLGLPLGTDLKSTCAGLLRHFSTNARTAYGLLVNAKTRYRKKFWIDSISLTQPLMSKP